MAFLTSVVGELSVEAFSLCLDREIEGEGGGRLR